MPGAKKALKFQRMAGDAFYICTSISDCVLNHFSRVQLFVTLWTGAQQAPLSVDCPGKNTRVGCHFLLQGILVMSQAWIHHNLEDCSLTLVSP